MKRSQIFYTGAYRALEGSVVSLLNSQPDFMTARTAASTRAAGDAIQDIICGGFEEILGDLCVEYSAEFARRSMADLAFKDKDGFYYVVDVKTHRLGTAFNMPNLTSVERLARFYEDDANYFTLMLVQYDIVDVKVEVGNAHFVPIEFLAWDCLTIGALGWGQIQIANANVVNIKSGYSRKKWMLELCDIMLQFYPKEIGKIGERIGYFERVRDRWKQRADQ
jgi:hypothetical protein